ncbi:MAG: hypothetical protein INR71_02400, partial [Terriglobus roseus]|nr:hypothetical protein [Terriglobus roseus]
SPANSPVNSPEGLGSPGDRPDSPIGPAEPPPGPVGPVDAVNAADNANNGQVNPSIPEPPPPPPPSPDRRSPSPPEPNPPRARLPSLETIIDVSSDSEVTEEIDLRRPDPPPLPPRNANRQAAATAVAHAFRHTCNNCAAVPAPGDNSQTLGEFAAHIQEQRYTTDDGHQHQIPHPLIEAELENLSFQELSSLPFGTLLGKVPDIPYLSLARSEEAHHPLPFTADNLTKTFDIDGLFVRLTSLEACHRGLELCLTPTFLGAITQNPHIPVPNFTRPVNRTKQLYFGRLNYSIPNTALHIFFPMLPCEDQHNPHLTDTEQEIWFDQVLLPALFSAVDKETWQHIPATFQEARAKAGARRERFITTGQHHMPMHTYIQPYSLASLWRAILHFLNNPRDPDQAAAVQRFRSPQLVYTGWNQKLETSSTDPYSVAHTFLQNFDIGVDRQFIRPQVSFVDFACETHPSYLGAHNPDFPFWVFINKVQCFDAWLNGLMAPGEQRRPQARTFSWGLNPDGGSVEADIHPDSAVYRGGFTYVKKYNVHKELFTTPFKGLNPLDHAQLEGLGYTLATITLWLDNRYALSHTTHNQILALYRHTKRRLQVAVMDAFTGANHFSTRCEVRVNFPYLDDVAAGAAASPELQDLLTRPAPPDAHRNFWALDGREVCNYFRSQLQRWLLPVEFCIAAARQPSPFHGPQEELNTASIVSVCLRTLVLGLFTGDISRKNALWKRHYDVHPLPLQAPRCRPGPRPAGGAPDPGNRPPTPDDDEGRSNSEDEGDPDPERRPLITRWGLDFEYTFRHFGTAWLPSKYFFWDPIRFRYGVVGKTAFPHNSFRGRLRAARELTPMDRQNHCDSLVKQQLRRLAFELRPDNARLVMEKLDFLTQLIAQAWLQHLFSHRKHNLDFRRHTPQMTDRIVDGLVGLDISLLRSLTDNDPDIVESRHNRKGTDHFARFDRTWVGKLRCLFDTRDVPPASTPVWDTLPWRQQIRRYCAWLDEFCGVPVRQVFMDLLPLELRRFLLVLPNFDKDKWQLQWKRVKPGDEPPPPCRRDKWQIAHIQLFMHHHPELDLEQACLRYSHHMQPGHSAAYYHGPTRNAAWTTDNANRFEDRLYPLNILTQGETLPTVYQCTPPKLLVHQHRDVFGLRHANRRDNVHIILDKAWLLWARVDRELEAQRNVELDLNRTDNEQEEGV